jgi:hypothetical protein
MSSATARRRATPRPVQPPTTIHAWPTCHRKVVSSEENVDARPQVSSTTTRSKTSPTRLSAGRQRGFRPARSQAASGACQHALRAGPPRIAGIREQSLGLSRYFCVTGSRAPRSSCRYP